MSIFYHKSSAERDAGQSSEPVESAPSLSSTSQPTGSDWEPSPGSKLGGMHRKRPFAPRSSIWNQGQAMWHPYEYWHPGEHHNKKDDVSPWRAGEAHSAFDTLHDIQPRHDDNRIFHSDNDSHRSYAQNQMLDALSLWTGGHHPAVRDPVKHDDSKSHTLTHGLMERPLLNTKENYQRAHELITHLANRQGRTKHELHRGMGLHRAILDKMKIGDTFSLGNASSWTHSPGVAYDFLRHEPPHIVPVNLRTNTTMGTRLNHLSKFIDEDEHILGGNVRINKIAHNPQTGGAVIDIGMLDGEASDMGKAIKPEGSSLQDWINWNLDKRHSPAPRKEEESGILTVTKGRRGRRGRDEDENDDLTGFGIIVRTDLQHEKEKKHAEELKKEHRKSFRGGSRANTSFLSRMGAERHGKNVKPPTEGVYQGDVPSRFYRSVTEEGEEKN